MAVGPPRVHEEGQRRTFLTPLQFAAFLEAAKITGPREYALAALFGMSGLRVAELCSLDVESMRVQSGHTVLWFVGKGGKPAEIPLPIAVSHAVTTYICVRTAGPMLLNRRGHRLTVDNATLSVKKLARTAHLDPDNVSPHSRQHLLHRWPDPRRAAPRNEYRHAVRRPKDHRPLRHGEKQHGQTRQPQSRLLPRRHGLIGVLRSPYRGAPTRGGHTAMHARGMHASTLVSGITVL